MNIIEVKNNLIKLCYEEDLSLSGLLLIQDNHRGYIAQILHLEATRVGKVAIAKIIFNYDHQIHAYDGTIPSLRAVITPFDTNNLLELLDKNNPLVLGKLSGQKDNITVDFDILKDNPIILAEKFFTTKVLLNNFAIQLQARKEKVVVIDTAGVFKNNKLTVTKDFRLPLNSSTINYIYEKGFEDATAESKSMIQSIFEELSEYSKTVEFIPFDTFKAVVDSEFVRTKLMQLVILKNKIKQIRDWGVFAQSEEEFKILKTKLEKDNTVVIDISCLKESLQKECIKYIYSVLKDIDAEFYAFTPIGSESSDKFLIQQIFETENVHTSLICDYDYSNLSELKKCSKNMLMFTPLKQQKDFGGYNVFLSKLAEDEFIAYGKMTKFVPLIGKLFQMSGADAYIPKVKETIQSIPVVQPQINEETSEIPVTEEPVIIEQVEVNAEPAVEQTTVPEKITEEIVQEDVIEPIEEVITEEFSTNEVEQNEESVVQNEVPEVEQSEEIIKEHSVEVNTVESTEIEEISAPQTETIKTPEIEISEMAGASAESVQPQYEQLVQQPVINEQIPQEIIEHENIQTVQENVTEENDVVNALNQVPDIDEEDELSDDDLDMIEELSKPDEEIPVINNQEQEIVETVQPEISEPAETVLPQEQVIETIQEEIVEPQPQPQSQPEIEPQPQPVNPVEDEVNSANMPTQVEQLQARTTKTPVVPEYSADIPEEDKVQSDVFQQGDRVFHPEFGEGVVEKMITYGDKLLCSVNFTNVGRRLLNPEVSEMKKIG